MAFEQKSLRQVTFFSALCLFLAAVEYAIPKPLPFLRLGVANLPVLLSLYVLPRRQTLALIAFKVLAQALITGTLFSYVSAFSAAGSFASGLAMLAAHSLLGQNGKISNIGLSIAGSLANNVAQIALARMFFFGPQARYIVTPLLAVGTASGLVMGLFANKFCNESRWYAKITEKTAVAAAGGGLPLPANPSQNYSKQPKTEKTGGCGKKKSSLATAKIQFLAALVLFPLFLLAPKIAALVARQGGAALTTADGVKISWLCVAVFFALTFAKRHGKVKVLPSVCVTLCVTLFALLSPSGKVLLSLRGFSVTEDALLLGLRKSASLVGMVFLSQFAISPRLDLPGKAGRFLQEVFSIFEALTEHKIRFRRGQIISSLDEKLCELLEK